jgi:chitodextrinase
MRTLFRLWAVVCLAVSLAPAQSWWQPHGEINWQWQLTTPVDLSITAAVYDVDGWDNDASVTAAIHAKGAKAICYIDLGTWENWRPDAASFPASVKGSGVAGWPGEQWLDIRQISLLSPIMTARMNMCKNKGFDAIEPDNIDGYTNGSGFPLTASDQIAYNTWIATTAHGLGMSVGLKNDLDQVPSLVSKFDWMLDEQCHEFSECSALNPFVSAGKTVFIAEYQGSSTAICPGSNAAGYSTIFKNINLTAPVTSCVTGGGGPPPPTDTAPPSVPTGLSASAASSSSVSLSWSASTDNVGVTGYRVKRGTTVVKTVTGTSTIDTGLSASTSYSYSIAAFDAAGNVSAFSAAASATTSANASVPQITAFGASPVTLAPGGSTMLAWTITGAQNVSIDNGVGVQLGTSVKVTPQVTTTYVITASNASGSTTASVKVTVTSGSATGLPTINSFTASPLSINSGQSSTLTWSVSGTGTTNTHKFLIYYGIPLNINGLASTSAAAAVFANYDYIVLGDGLEDPAHSAHASTIAVIAAIKAIKPTIEIFGYIDLGIITQNLSLATIATKQAQWKTTGATGIFHDDAGYDFHVTRARQNSAVDSAHALGLPVVLNAFVPADAFGSGVDVTYNPAGTATHMASCDGYLLESWIVNSVAYSSTGGWESTSDVKIRADAVQAFRAALNIRVFAEGSVDWTTTAPTLQATYFQVLEGGAAIYSWDAYGLNTYQFSSAAPNANVVKTEPYSQTFNGAFNPGDPFSYASGTQTYTRGDITLVLSSPQSATLPAETVTIDNGVGALSASSTSVSPVSTTTYTLTATNSKGFVTATVTVTVDTLDVPIIATFAASPASVPSGQTVTLSWSVQKETSLSIDQGVGLVTGTTSVTVTPRSTTIYTLTATNGDGESKAMVTVHVIIVGGPGTPRPPRWPGNPCDEEHQFRGFDHSRSTLAADINATDLAILVDDASSFGAHEVVRIDSELMELCGVTGDTLTVCTGTRGLAGTVAAPHAMESYISGAIAAILHNQSVAELVALENALWGHAGSTIGHLAGSTVGPTSWPDHPVTEDELMYATDATQTLLSNIMDNSQLTVPVQAGGNFRPNVGRNTNELIGIDTEIIRICSVTNTVLTVCPGGRGFAGTTAAAHNQRAAVIGVYAAYLHNRLAAEIAALQADLFPTLGGGAWDHAVTASELLIAAHGLITADYHNLPAAALITLETAIFGRVP